MNKRMFSFFSCFVVMLILIGASALTANAQRARASSSIAQVCALDATATSGIGLENFDVVSAPDLFLHPNDTDIVVTESGIYFITIGARVGSAVETLTGGDVSFWVAVNGVPQAYTLATQTISFSGEFEVVTMVVPLSLAANDAVSVGCVSTVDGLGILVPSAPGIAGTKH